MGITLRTGSVEFEENDASQQIVPAPEPLMMGWRRHALFKLGGKKSKDGQSLLNWLVHFELYMGDLETWRIAGAVGSLRKIILLVCDPLDRLEPRCVFSEVPYLSVPGVVEDLPLTQHLYAYRGDYLGSQGGQLGPSSSQHCLLKQKSSLGYYLRLGIPIGSMYAIYGNIYHQYTPNVSTYTIHGSYGIWYEALVTVMRDVELQGRALTCPNQLD